MASLTTTFTVTAAQLFEACCPQVAPELHARLRVEIERRWPDGLRIPIHLTALPQGQA